jgi:hypothetical protein
LSCYNIGIGRRWNTGISWVEEGKEVETVEEVEEKECERGFLEMDGDLKKEGKKKDQELTRIGCFCFAGVSGTFSSYEFQLESML